jgi:Tfp pilus assembly protein PilF
LRPRYLLSLSLLIASGAFPCLAHNGGQGDPAEGPPVSSHGFTVSGTVRDADNSQALSGIRVDLMVTGVPRGSTFTNELGQFEFEGVPNGESVIRVHAEGYQALEQNIEVSHAPVYGVSIDLRKSAGNASAPNGPVVSAHQLGVPSKAQKEFDKGIDLISSKADYRGAIAVFDRAIQDYPDYYEAYAFEGTAYEGLPDMPSAEKAMRKSVELSSGKYPVALYFLAGLLNATNRFSEAEDLARQCVALDESSWHGHFELAHALLGLRKLSEAEASANRARDLKSDNPLVYLLLANIHSAQKNYIGFVQDLDSYLALSPTGPMADEVRKRRAQVQQTLHDSQTGTPPPPPPAQQP